METADKAKATNNTSLPPPPPSSPPPPPPPLTPFTPPTLPRHFAHYKYYQNAYNFKVKNGKWVEDLIGMDLAKNPPNHPTLYTTEQREKLIPPSEMIDRSGGEDVKMLSMEEITFKNKVRGERVNGEGGGGWGVEDWKSSGSDDRNGQNRSEQIRS